MILLQYNVLQLFLNTELVTSVTNVLKVFLSRRKRNVRLCFWLNDVMEMRSFLDCFRSIDRDVNPPIFTFICVVSDHRGRDHISSDSGAVPTHLRGQGWGQQP